jgi:hypothetical protein
MRMRMLAAVAAFSMIGMFGVVASATAAVAPSSHNGNSVATASIQSRAQSPSSSESPANKTCPMVKSRFRIYNKSCGLIRAYLCFHGNHGNFAKAPRYASNGCGTRVWIYPGKGEQGDGLCISRRSFTNSLKKEYLSFKVVSNPSSC